MQIYANTASYCGPWLLDSEYTFPQNTTVTAAEPPRLGCKAELLWTSGTAFSRPLSLLREAVSSWVSFKFNHSLQRVSTLESTHQSSGDLCPCW